MGQENTDILVAFPIVVEIIIRRAFRLGVGRRLGRFLRRRLAFGRLLFVLKRRCHRLAPRAEHVEVARFQKVTVIFVGKLFQASFVHAQGEGAGFQDFAEVPGINFGVLGEDFRGPCKKQLAAEGRDGIHAPTFCLRVGCHDEGHAAFEKLHQVGARCFNTVGGAGIDRFLRFRRFFLFGRWRDLGFFLLTVSRGPFVFRLLVLLALFRTTFFTVFLVAGRFAPGLGRARRRSCGRATEGGGDIGAADRCRQQDHQ